jgi:hypothetical protein
VAPSISDLLNHLEFESFTGREAELQLINEQVKMNRKQWNVLHFHGISGIGKTAILLRFKQISSEHHVVYFRPEHEIETVEQFLNVLSEQLANQKVLSNDVLQAKTPPQLTTQIIHQLNKISNQKPPLILLFDSLEHWKPITKWLFESFIPHLSADIRLISAGREPLEEKWMHANAWSLLVKNVTLKPLNKENVREYLNTVGIDDSVLKREIVNLSSGIPFAMKLCSQWVDEREPQIETADFKQIIRALCQRVFESIGLTASERSLLEAASVVGQFDMELLSSIMDETLSYKVFDKFCEMPIIMKRAEGWSIYEGIGNWIQSHFKDHSPELFEQYKKHAMKVLYRRWVAADPLKRRSLFLENVYAAGNKLLQEYYFFGDDTVYDIRTARKEDLPIIMDIWKNRHLNILQSVNDGTEQEKLIPKVWELEPTAIKAFWENDQIVGFTSIVSFTKKAREIFLKNDLYRKYLLRTEPQENERLFWIGATAKKDDYEALNAIYRYFFQHTMDQCLCTVMFPTDYDVSGLLSLGCKEIPWAAAVTPSGKKFRMLQGDFRDVSIMQLLTTSYPIKQRKALPQKEAVSFMKRILHSFHDIDTDSDLLDEVAAMMGQHPNDLSGDTIRHAIKRELQKIEIRSEKDRLKMRAIELYYMERVGTNEVVAERLHLSISTYYRYVREGIEKLAFEFTRQK